MTNPVMILNVAGDRGQLKAAILCDRLTWANVTYRYEKVGDCHTVTVSEADVKQALGGTN